MASNQAASGLDAFERLSRLDTHGARVLSVYLDLDPTRFPTPGTRQAQLGSLLDTAAREAGTREADRVKAWLESNPRAIAGARGLAIFSSAEADLLEVVPLPQAVEPLAVADHVPWLEPLAVMIVPGDWCVAVVGRRRSRLLRGDGDRLTQLAVIEGELHRRHRQGGWSQARFQRGIEQQVAWHVREVTERLRRVHLRRPISHLVIICSDELRPVVEHDLGNELLAVLTDTIDADLERAGVDQIGALLAPVIERTERAAEHELIEQLEQALGTGDRAAAGLDEVLATLEQQRVETLLVGDGRRLTAGLCPTCGRLTTDGERRCPLDGSILSEVDGTEYALEEAARQSAHVTVARYESDWLHEHGEIAALLRW